MEAEFVKEEAIQEIERKSRIEAEETRSRSEAEKRSRSGSVSSHRIIVSTDQQPKQAGSSRRFPTINLPAASPAPIPLGFQAIPFSTMETSRWVAGAAAIIMSVLTVIVIVLAIMSFV